MDDKCKTCGNIDHTTDEHEIFKDLFKKSKEDLVSIIISLEVKNGESKIMDPINGWLYLWKKSEKRPHRYSNSMQSSILQ